MEGGGGRNAPQGVSGGGAIVVWMRSGPLYFAEEMRRVLDESWDLSGVEAAVLVQLMLCADRGDVAWVTRARLAARSRFSEDTVKRALRSLREKGLVGEPVRRVLDAGVMYGHPLLVDRVEGPDPDDVPF